MADLKVLIHAFISGKFTESGFVENLQRVDYQVVTDWEQIQINKTEKEEV